MNCCVILFLSSKQQLKQQVLILWQDKILFIQKFSITLFCLAMKYAWNQRNCLRSCCKKVLMPLETIFKFYGLCFQFGHTKTEAINFYVNFPSIFFFGAKQFFICFEKRLFVRQIIFWFCSKLFFSWFFLSLFDYQKENLG